jgi:mRNA-degrading endonuclease RelE of RelBE toxin-antitoxin system
MAVVVYERDAAEQLAALPISIKRRIAAIVMRLERWPAVSGVKPLRGQLAGHFRMRTGDYRLQFHVQGDTVVIERVGHRDGFYED